MRWKSAVALLLVTAALGFGYALDFSSTPEEVIKALGKPEKVERDEVIGLMVWEYKKGRITFQHRKVIGYDQTEESLSFDLGKRKNGVFLKYWMKSDAIPSALGTPSKVTPNPKEDREFVLWYFKNLPAPNGKEASVAVYKGRVMAWSVGDKNNYYICHPWEEMKDHFNTPVQRRVMKRVGNPTAVIRAVRNGKRRFLRYLFHIQEEVIYQIEFQDDLPEGYRVLNSEERAVRLQKLIQLHPPESAKMTKKTIMTLPNPRKRLAKKKSLWERFRLNLEPERDFTRLSR